MGDHKRHREVVQAVPEGMIGGAVCKCKGECVDGRYESKELRRIAKLMVRASRRRAKQTTRRRHSSGVRTVLTDDEVWDLRSSLAYLIADGLERLAAAGMSTPVDVDGETWQKQLRGAAASFRASVEGDDTPTEGLDFLRSRWRDLWD
jgi:hypothetical protein